tara:strand:- start:48 stop:182 length:135 start_codon:yes stop_codon:yes gene_type:complete
MMNIRQDDKISKCCGALPLTEIYDNMGKCSKCKEDTEFFKEDEV